MYTKIEKIYMYIFTMFNKSICFQGNIKMKSNTQLFNFISNKIIIRFDYMKHVNEVIN